MLEAFSLRWVLRKHNLNCTAQVADLWEPEIYIIHVHGILYIVGDGGLCSICRSCAIFFYSIHSKSTFYPIYWEVYHHKFV